LNDKPTSVRYCRTNSFTHFRLQMHAIANTLCRPTGTVIATQRPECAECYSD